MPPTTPSSEETQQLRPLGPNLYRMSGHVIDEFQLGEVIGKGGAGVVYAAEDQTLHRKVAFKLLRPAGINGTGDAEERFLREARAVAKLDHPNIVQIHRVGQCDGAHYIVMQLIDGQTLNEHVAENPSDDITQALRITRQVAEALQVAHEHGITHRDIKPSNIMIDTKGRVKVMDFGLARHGESDIQLTEPGMYIGTPKYSSPEQCETKSIDQRSDLYSLGVILYELLSGQAPHQANTPMALMHQIIYEAPVDIRTLKKELPEPVCALLEGLLVKKPDNRTQSAAELISAINEILGETDNQGLVAAKPNRSKWLGIGLVTAVCVVAGIMMLNRPNTSTVEPPVVTPPTHVGNQQLAQQLTFAMYDFQNLTNDAELQWMEIGMSDLITANLSQYPSIKVLSRDQIIWSDSNAGATRAKRVDDNLRPRLKDLNVDVVAKGKIVRVQDEVRVVTILYKLGEDEILKSFSHTDDVSNLFALVDRVGDDISEYFVQQQPPTETVLSEAQAGDQRQSKGTWAIFSKRIANGTPAYAMASIGKKRQLVDSLSRPKSLRPGAEKKPATLRRLEAKVERESDAVATADEGLAAETLELLDVKLEAPVLVAPASISVVDQARDIPEALAETTANYSDGQTKNDQAKGGYGHAELGDADVVNVLPYYYRGLRFLSENGIPPDSPSACRVTLCRQLAAEAKKGRPIAAALKRWQEKVLAKKK